MKIIVAHSFYREAGGEDSVVASEIDLLRRHGHEVFEFFCDNKKLESGFIVFSAIKSVWSWPVYRDMRQLIAMTRPDVVHVHNTFPAMSPAVYWAAVRSSVPVVQTLHNFRLFCLQAMFLRDGKVCERCLGHSMWRGVLWGCYRSSRIYSAYSYFINLVHRLIGTYEKKISRYIALNNFCRDKFIQGGIPAEKISIKPNFVDDPGLANVGRSGVLFVGRLSHEKGISILADAWKMVADGGLSVVGQGEDACHFSSSLGVNLLGRLDKSGVERMMHSSVALVVPSIWYENFPRVIVEAYACGLPVIASRIGALVEIVEDGETGLLFSAGDADDLAEKLKWALSHPDEMKVMGIKCREKYLRHYSESVNLNSLLEIYKSAASSCK